MRQIKFRVWHKPTQTMHHYLKAKFGPNYMNITLEGKFKDVDQITSLTVPNNELEVMQFTGLTDNKGTEMYEGDIYAMLFPNGEWGSPEVVTWNNELCGFNLLPNIIREVLGNIYENPDLLK